MEAIGDLEFRHIPFEGIDAAVDVHVEQHIGRWGTKGGSLFSDPRNVTFLKDILKISYSKGFGIGYELKLGDEVLAQTFAFEDLDVVRAFRIGMNNKFSKMSPGMVAAYLFMTEMNKKGHTSIELGQAGAGDYKHRLGGVEMPITWLTVRRGLPSFLSRAMSSPVGQRLDSVLGIKERFFGGVYR